MIAVTEEVVAHLAIKIRDFILEDKEFEGLSPIETSLVLAAVIFNIGVDLGEIKTNEKDL